MNQTQRLIDSIRDAPDDAVIVAGMFAIPVLIALWIVNRMRHPERGLLHALVIASVGFVLVPCVSSAVLILWVRTGGSRCPSIRRVSVLLGQSLARPDLVLDAFAGWISGDVQDDALASLVDECKLHKRARLCEK